MKKVKFVEARVKRKILRRINEELEKNISAELVGVVQRNNLFTAFIQFER